MYFWIGGYMYFGVLLQTNGIVRYMYMYICPGIQKGLFPIPSIPARETDQLPDHNYILRMDLKGRNTCTL